MTTYHERDLESGYDYRGARFYDSEVGRFLSVDPLAADFAAWSTYNYVLGNPIIFVDPTGMATEAPEGWSEANIDLANRFGIFGRGEEKIKEKEPPINGLDYFKDDTGEYYWNAGKGSYDHHDTKTGKYLGQYDASKFAEPVGNYSIVFDMLTDNSTDPSILFNGKHTPLAAMTYFLSLYNKGGLKSLSNESMYPGVKIYSSPHQGGGGITLGNLIFVNEAYYKSKILPNGGNSLVEHEYGHYLDFKFHFKYNFTGYTWQIGLPSIGSAAKMGTYKGRHSANPSERRANILSKAFFHR